EEMTVEFSQEALRGTGVVANISRGGMFVRTPRIPGTGPLLRLTVHLPEGRTLFLTGNVVRSGAAPLSTSVSSAGFGLRLSGDSPDYAKLLSQLPDKSKT
ncbi:MAG: PilZ domain-containing protein, partial [Acidobacteriota bacterium]|nr:PilZ domain-containing protein [Acidobacteriota bacterium]